MFIVHNKDTRTTTMVSFWCLYANFEDISHLVLVFVVNFEDVIAGWVVGLEHTQYV